MPIFEKSKILKFSQPLSDYRFFEKTTVHTGQGRHPKISI
jgi:hypothetical protein